MADNISRFTARVPFYVFLNASTTVLNALAGFLTLPFLIERLGPSTYGLWALIVAITGYFLVFDSGFTGAVGRLVSGKRLVDDIGGLNAVVSTALVGALPLCILIALAASSISVPFFWLFDVPEVQTGDVRMALLLLGFAMALSLPESIFYALLWGYERFDLQNLVEAVVVLLRTALIFLLIDPDSTLVDLSLIMVGAGAFGFVCRSCLCWLAEPRLSLRPRRWSRDIFYDLFAFGSWFALLRLSRSRLQDVGIFVIGHLLGTAAVTTFTIPKMLVTYSNLLAQSVTQVAAPRAAAYHFGQLHAEQRALFLTGGQYSLAISLYVFGGFVAVGLPFLALWQPGNQVEEYQLLLILGVGEIVPLSQWATYSAIVGIGQHRRLALLALAEALLILVSTYLAATQFGLVGAASAIAANAFLFRGLFQCIYGCQLLNISLADYARAVVLPIFGPASLMIFLIFTAKFLFTLASWTNISVFLIVYTSVYWAGLLMVLYGWRSVGSLVRATFARLREGVFR